jgi:hypothetical protein
VTVEFGENGRLTLGGRDVCGYEAGRWYTLALRYSPSQKKAALAVRNDAAQDAGSWTTDVVSDSSVDASGSPQRTGATERFF